MGRRECEKRVGKWASARGERGIREGSGKR